MKEYKIGNLVSLSDLSHIKQGIIKYRHKTNQIKFDDFFIELFGIEKKIKPVYTDIGSKDIVSNVNLQKVVDFVIVGGEEDKFEKLVMDDGPHNISLYIKKIDETDKLSVFCFLTTPRAENELTNYDILNNFLDVTRETNSINMFYIDLKKDHSVFNKNFYKRFGIKSKKFSELSKDYGEVMIKAAALLPESSALITLQQQAFQDTITGKKESWIGKYPMVSTEGNIVWIETIGRVVKKDRFNRPETLAGIDYIYPQETETNVEERVSQSILGSSLDYSDIGIFWIRIEGDTRIQQYDKKARDLVGYKVVNEIESPEFRVFVYDDEWTQVKERTLEKFPEFNVYYEDDIDKFSKLISNEAENYHSIVPFLHENGEVKWVEFRANVLDRNEKNVPKFIAGAVVDITELFEAGNVQIYDNEKTMQYQQAKNKAIEMANLLIWSIDFSVDKQGTYAYSSSNYNDTLGLEKSKDGAVSIKDFYRTVVDDEEDTFSVKDLQKLVIACDKGEMDSFEDILVKHKNPKTNKITYMKHFGTVVSRNAKGGMIQLSGYLIDVTRETKIQKVNQRLAEANLRSQQFNELAVSAGSLMVYNFEQSKSLEEAVLYCNENFISKLGLPEQENNLYSWSDYLETFVDDAEGEKMKLESEKAYGELLSKDNKITRLITKNRNLQTGEIMFLEHFSQAEVDDENEIVSYGGFLRDITHEIMSDRRLKYLAENDVLTGLYNRNMYEQFTQEEPEKKYSLMVFDIDGLKLANDVYGHSIGDRILKDFAVFLKEVFPKEENIFRVGGDEFVVITIGDDIEYISDGIANLKQKLHTYSKDNQYSILVSSGYCIANDIDYKTAFTAAENDMYRNKLSSRNGRKQIFFSHLISNLYKETDENEEHCNRISHLAKKVLLGYGWMRTLGLDDIGIAAKFHDIGKLTIDRSILKKKDSLSKEERDEINNHAESGYKIIINILGSDDVAEAILYHHERYDGLGYPYGLKGDEIPLYARIIAICDTFVSLITERPYRKAYPVKKAIDEIKKGRWKQFDPEIVDIFLDVVKKEQFL